MRETRETRERERERKIERERGGGEGETESSCYKVSAFSLFSHHKSQLRQLNTNKTLLP